VLVRPEVSCSTLDSSMLLYETLISFDIKLGARYSSSQLLLHTCKQMASSIVCSCPTFVTAGTTDWCIIDIQVCVCSIVSLNGDATAAHCCELYFQSVQLQLSCFVNFTFAQTNFYEFAHTYKTRYCAVTYIRAMRYHIASQSSSR
jgi:hypothetical protein